MGYLMVNKVIGLEYWPDSDSRSSSSAAIEVNFYGDLIKPNRNHLISYEQHFLVTAFV